MQRPYLTESIREGFLGAEAFQLENDLVLEREREEAGDRLGCRL